MRLRVVVGCGLAILTCRSPASPSVVLTGAWDYSFSAVSPVVCPGPFPHPQGCGGVGDLRLDHVGSALSGTHTEVFGCQDCRMAADGGGSGPLKNAEVSGKTFAFTTTICRFTASVPDGMVDTVHGVVSCAPWVGLEVQGTWRMTRVR